MPLAGIEELLTPSEDRIEPECKVYKRCGGCSLQHLSYDAQLRFKQKRVTDCIRRIAKSDAKVNDIIACSKKTRYRNKTAFPVRRDESGALRIGCFSLRSHHVVDIDDCLISSEKCAKIIGVIRQFIEQKGISIYDEVSKKGLLRHIVVRESSSGNIIVALVINADDIPNKSEWIEALKPYIDSIALNINKSEGNAILSSKTNVIYGSGAIREHICGLDFDVSINSFLQVNHEQTEKLYSLAMDLADITDEKVVVDLYCGIGTISLIAAKRAKTVYGIEIVPQAIENANKNKQLNRNNQRALYLRRLRGRFLKNSKAMRSSRCRNRRPSEKGPFKKGNRRYMRLRNTQNRLYFMRSGNPCKRYSNLLPERVLLKVCDAPSICSPTPAQ